jgi:hypothetical protein
MRVLMLSVLALTAVVLVLGGCSTAANVTTLNLTNAYWTRPSASLQEVADESRACYVAAVQAVEGEYPSAFPAAGVPGPRGGRLLPPTEPPPKLWARSPREAGFARFDEQLRYERCMRQRGWSATRS